MPKTPKAQTPEIGRKIAKKMAKITQKWTKMVWNGYTNGPNEAMNTSTKFPHQKLWNIDEKLGEIGRKNGPKWSETKISSPISKIEQFLFYGSTKISLSKCAKLIGQSQIGKFLSKYTKLIGQSKKITIFQI